MLYRKLINQPILSSSRHDKNSVKTKLKDIALTGYRTYTPPRSVFSDDEFKIIKALKEDNNIVIMKPDKGNGVNKEDYKRKVETILDDNNKFTELHDDPVKLTMKRE